MTAADRRPGANADPLSDADAGSFFVGRAAVGGSAGPTGL
jgi:hypothetical protein